MKTETFEAAWWKRVIPKPKKKPAKTKRERDQEGERKKYLEGQKKEAAKKKKGEMKAKVEGNYDRNEPATKAPQTATVEGNYERVEGGGGSGYANAKCEFEQEMMGEGISLTPTGRNIAGEIAKAYLPKYPKCYRKALMGFFGGDKCQEGIFWVKVTDAQQKSEMRAKAKNMNCDVVETKGAEGLNVNNINMAAEFVHRDLGTKVRSLF